MYIQPNLLTTWGNYFSLAWKWTVDHWFELMIVVVLMLVLWAMVTTIKKLKKWRLRGFLKERAERMTPEEKARYLKKIVGQGIHDALFEAWTNGEISGDDYQRECRRFGNIFDLSDLLPKQQKLLKAKLKERIKQLRSSAKPEIPGPPDAQKNVEEAEAPKTAVSSFMSSFLSLRKAG